MIREPHHDGSELYVLEQPDELGGEATVRVRVPRGAADWVRLRHVADGEPRVAQAVVDEESESEVWWRATFPAVNPVTRYRWLLGGGDTGYGWLNGRGVIRHDTPDADDFVLALGAGGPDWHLGSVVYQVFPDRFASSGNGKVPPDWVVPRGWDEPPTGRGPETPVEWFGGDLRGLEARLDHVESLGANLLYLTPIFPARSTHRYDSTSFDHVDPLLGGDAALSSLVAAAHARGIRVVGDLTVNHVGDSHGWFRAAREDEAAPERGFFWFDESLPHGYEAWLGVPSLPKLDLRSAELRRRVADVVQHWLEPPFDLDGWRIDVANMAGRRRDVDVNAAVALETRQALEAAKPDALLVAEHGHDFRPDVGGSGWHGAMNYSGFLRPVWWWLRGDGFAHDPFLDVPAPRFEGGQSVATMRAFRAGIPWESVLHSWVLLDSHDTARFRTVTGSRERHLVGLGLQMTTPGVPMVFAGDELGLEGEWGEDARRTMPWDRPDTWDRSLLAEFRRLIALRRSEVALARGGIRYVHVDADVIAYVRETRDDRLLCLASRAPHVPVRLAETPLETLYGDGATRAEGGTLFPADGPAFHVWRLE